jgi:vacuolar-type H+-ATPase subunit F/Vma7
VSRAAALGEDVRVTGYALAGAEVHPAANAEAALEAWDRLADDVDCLILTPAALDALRDRLHERPYLVWAVLPE